MLPHLELGSARVPLYPVFLAGGVLLCWALLLRRTTRLGYPWTKVLAWVAVAFPVGALGGRALAAAVELALGTAPSFEQAGMSVLGSMIACLLFSWWLVPRLFGEPAWRLLDAVAFTLPLSMMFGRLGCLALGCCFGRPMSGGATGLLGIPLASYADTTAPTVFYSDAAPGLVLWNLPLLLIAGSAVTIVVVEWYSRRDPPLGATVTLALTLELGGRALIEIARGGPWIADGKANPWQLLTAAGALAAFASWRWRRTKIVAKTSGNRYSY